jgi:hypothetical protein
MDKTIESEFDDLPTILSLSSLEYTQIPEVYRYGNCK